MTTSCVLHPLQLRLALTNLLKLKANAKMDIKLICVFFLVSVAIRCYVLSCFIIFVIITSVFSCGSIRTPKFEIRPRHQKRLGTTGLVHGRGHGGTAIYWSKNHKASSFSNWDGSIIGLRVFLKKIRVVFN